jgi:hypothetical protein
MHVSDVWRFIAGDSRRAPLAVLAAFGVAFSLLRWSPLPGPAVGATFAIIIAVGLAAAVFEPSR